MKITLPNGKPIRGIKNVCSVTRNLNPYEDIYVQISLDLSTGDLYHDTHVGCNSWSVYRDDDVVTVARTKNPMSMREIVAAIASARINHTQGWRDQRYAGGYQQIGDPTITSADERRMRWDM